MRTRQTLVAVVRCAVWAGAVSWVLLAAAQTSLPATVPRPNNADQPWAVEDVQRGFAIMADRSLGNCGACHAWRGPQAANSSLAPRLDGVAQRYSTELLTQWISDARRIQPATLMPPFGSTQGTRQPSSGQAVLSAAQIRQVVLALQTLPPSTGAVPPLVAVAPAAASHAWSPPPASERRRSGYVFLSPSLQQMNDDGMANPMALWVERGDNLWQDSSSGPACQSCHSDAKAVQRFATQHPRLQSDGTTLVNLEDQIVLCRARQGQRNQLEDDAVLALSAWLHAQAKGLPVDVQAPAGQSHQWQAQLGMGAELYAARQGRMNLACMHCHDSHVGAQMRGDVISPGHPTGFPIYRLGWQQAGSLDRRLRACFSGVQSQIPSPGHPDLRRLELFLKVRANGMPLEGPSVRR